MSKSRERCTIHFCKTNNRGVGVREDEVLWHNSKREKMKLKVLDLFIFAIRRYSHVHGFTDEFKVTGYTTFKANYKSADNSVKYYTKEYMNSEKRYEYAMIEFVSDDEAIATYPAMILGFVRCNITLGISTPHFTDNEKLLLILYKKTWLLTTTYLWWFIPYQIMYQWNNWKRSLCHVQTWKYYELCVHCQG